MTPERSVMVSPVAASIRGVATRTAAARNAANQNQDVHSARGLTWSDPLSHHARNPVHPPRGAVASRATMITTASTTYTATAGTPASRCIAPAPASSAPNSMPATTTPDRMQTAQQCHGDSGEAVPGRQVLKQGIRYAAHLHAAGQSCDRTREQQRHRRHAAGCRSRPLTSAARGPSPTARSRNPQSVLAKTNHRIRPPASAMTEAGMQPRAGQQG